MTKIETIRRRIRDLKWRARDRYYHARRAWRYVRGTLTEDDAAWIADECALISRRYPLESLSGESVLEHCRERWGDFPALAELVTEACERVAWKWSGDGEATGAAEDWAMEKVIELAEDRGIVLTDSWDDEAEAAA